MAIVIFEKIKYKNFLSTGNAFTEIILNTDGSTLIKGKNGSGKSTIQDTITFGLFGKAFRAINKAQIVNSINKKNCIVEIYFSIGSKSYKIIRGIKPNIFEIYCDEELLNQPSDTRDYQVILEQQILKMNFKVFSQIVILGSSSYIPFMKLNAGSRREVVDEILSVGVFTDMNELLKEDMKTTKETLKDYDSRLVILRTQAESQKRVITILKQQAEDGSKLLENKITNILSELDYENKKLAEMSDRVIDCSGINSEELNSELQNIRRSLYTNEDRVKGIKKTLTFYEQGNCPTCSQVLPDKEAKIQEALDENEVYQVSIQDFRLKEQVYAKKYNDALAIIQQYNTHQNNITSQSNIIQNLNRQLVQINSELSNHKDTSKEIDSEKIIFDDIVTKGKELSASKNEVALKKDIQEICSLLLKDSGIKTVVIKEYLPAINSLINKYLKDMEFFVKFDLDEQFNESIKSRHRDDFSYMCFSEGERMRIDLAIMFTFREIAKMKSSIDTNLLILDEILDGTLDATGVEFLLDFISEQKRSNIMVISHKPDIQDKFDRVITFVKKGDFSVIDY